MQRVIVVAVVVVGMFVGAFVGTSPARPAEKRATWCTTGACVHKAQRRARREHRRWVRRQWALPCSWSACPRPQRRYWRRERAALSDGVRSLLRALRGCESGGNYRTASLYRGAYQYDYRTWGEAGGHGDPAAAIAAEQDTRTARFYPGHESRWPNCP